MHLRDRSTWPRWTRVLTNGWVLSPLIVFALLLATFEGYGYYTRHQKTTYARGGAFGAGASAAVDAGHRARGHSRGVGAATGGKHHGGTMESSGGRTASFGTSSGGGSSASTHGSTTSTSAPSGSGSSHHHGSRASRSATPPTGLAVPTAGTYTLAVTGSENAKFGPISACHNSYPNRATLDIHHAAGESPTSYDFDMRLYPGSPNKHDERHIYHYSKNAVTLTYEQETVTCSGIKQSTTVGYSPAQIRVESPLTVGATWHNHGGGSARTETGSSNVVRKTALSINGHSYEVYEIVTRLQMSGDETGERDQTWWYSPDLGVPLKFSESLHGKRSGASYSESYTATVVSLP